MNAAAPNIRGCALRVCGAGMYQSGSSSTRRVIGDEWDRVLGNRSIRIGRHGEPLEFFGVDDLDVGGAGVVHGRTVRHIRRFSQAASES